MLGTSMAQVYILSFVNRMATRRQFSIYSIFSFNNVNEKRIEQKWRFLCCFTSVDRYRLPDLRIFGDSCAHDQRNGKNEIKLQKSENTPCSHQAMRFRRNAETTEHIDDNDAGYKFSCAPSLFEDWFNGDSRGA